MIICIRTFEYNLQYDKWETSLTLLKDLIHDCYLDINQPISTCCNIYTYHGYDLTYIDFYNISNDVNMFEIIKQRSSSYLEFEIVDCTSIDGDLVLVQDEEEDDNDDDDIVQKVQSLSVRNDVYCGNKSDSEISEFILSMMNGRIIYYDDTLYAYEDQKGWVSYDRDKLFSHVSENIRNLFGDRQDIIHYLASYNRRMNIISEMVMRIKTFHSADEINAWNLIGFKNGIYDNDNGTFHTFSSHLRATLSTKIDYYMSIDDHDHMLSSILEKIFPNPIVFKCVMRWFGYLLVSGNPEKYVTIWHGSTGNNGKSWIQRLIREAFGDYYATLPISLLTNKRGQSNSATPELSFLEDRLVVMLQEPDTTERMNGGRVKELTGNDSIYTRELYKSPRSIRIRAKIVVVANNRIETVGLDSAIRRRFLVIPFESTFVTQAELDTRNNKNLDTKHYYIRKNIDHLCKILSPAFIRIAISQHQLYLKYGMDIDKEFYQYTTDFIMSNNKILKFIHRYLVQDAGQQLLISTVYENFKSWYRELYPSMRTPDYDAFMDELVKESIRIVDDRYIQDYQCIF